MAHGSSVIFAKEKASDSLFAELGPLLQNHWEEIAHNKDIPLEPDFSSYQKFEDTGILRIFTARDQAQTLIGYAVFFVSPNPHYKSSIQATQDVIFIEKDRRGFGSHFIDWCDSQLKAEGIQIVYHHIKFAHDWGQLLERLGYRAVDKIYSRRLDG